MSNEERGRVSKWVQQTIMDSIVDVIDNIIDKDNRQNNTTVGKYIG